jgi:hypothetical protein
MLLRCWGKALDFAELDRSTSEIRFLRKGELSSDDLARIAGSYAVESDSLVCFYRIGHELRLRIGEREILITNGVSSVLERSSNSLPAKLKSIFMPSTMSNVLRVFDSGKVILEFKYTPPESDRRSSWDLTPFVDEEHLDLLLFVHNVLNDSERRKIM